MKPKIPIVAITGFLGSGKTTLLTHLLENRLGLKVGVIVNDYGDINVDAELVADQTDEMLELTNGCICCTLDSLELDEAIEQFTHPKGSVDFIVIEASGLAEPEDLAHTLRASVNESAYLDSIVAVIDSEHVFHNSDSIHLAKRQITHSDFVIINKLDLTDGIRLGEIRELIQEVNPRARIFETSYAKIDLHLLLGVIDQEENESADHDRHDHRHLHEEYQTVTFRSDKALDPVAFQEFVNKSIPSAVYRIKGWVDFGSKGEDRKYLFQQVGKRSELTWADWDSGRETRLVFIGRNFDADELINRISECVDKKPDSQLSQPLRVPQSR